MKRIQCKASMKNVLYPNSYRITYDPLILKCVIVKRIPHEKRNLPQHAKADFEFPPTTYGYYGVLVNQHALSINHDYIALNMY